MGSIPVPLDEGLAASTFGDARRSVGPTSQLLLVCAAIHRFHWPIIVVSALSVLAAQ